MGRTADNPQIIGLTGSFGSGCTYIAEQILSTMGYQSLSLSGQLKEEYHAANGVKDIRDVPRRELQDFGDALRKEKGAAYLAQMIRERITQSRDSKAGWVIDSIRNPAEAHFLRGSFPSFFLFGVYAPKEVRWERIKDEKYKLNRRDFEEDDERDTGHSSEEEGQRVEDCFAEADVVLSNEARCHELHAEAFDELVGKVGRYVQLISKPLTRRQPTPRECLMAAAYTVSQSSSCMKRKVGAVIVDDNGNIITSGFNEVPRLTSPCQRKYGKCSRTRDWEKFSKFFARSNPGSSSSSQESILQEFRREFRLLDHCRALHAEENAIVNLARHGRSIPLEKCTLYTTTYPCRLCANKIVNLGLGAVVYLEPYPDEEAKEILKDGGVKDIFFEGITFKAYSRIYGEKK